MKFRPMGQTDIPIMHAAIEALGWNSQAKPFRKYLEEQLAGTRVVWVVYDDDKFVGYVTLKLNSDYPRFKLHGIPEINDLNVLPEFRRQGIASRLLDLAEDEALKRGCKQIGLGVGLYSDYGSSQRLYIKRGYVPDGYGITHKNKQLEYGDNAIVDDDLVLWLVKKISL